MPTGISIQFLTIHHTCVISFDICGTGFIKTGAEAGAVTGDSPLRADATAAGDNFYLLNIFLERPLLILAFFRTNPS